MTMPAVQPDGRSGGTVPADRLFCLTTCRLRPDRRWCGAGLPFVGSLAVHPFRHPCDRQHAPHWNPAPSPPPPEALAPTDPFVGSQAPSGRPCFDGRNPRHRSKRTPRESRKGAAGLIRAVGIRHRAKKRSDGSPGQGQAAKWLSQPPGPGRHQPRCPSCNRGQGPCPGQIPDCLSCPGLLTGCRRAKGYKAIFVRNSTRD